MNKYKITFLNTLLNRVSNCAIEANSEEEARETFKTRYREFCQIQTVELMKGK